MKYGYEGPEAKRRAGGFVFKAGVPKDVGEKPLTDAVLADFKAKGIVEVGAVAEPVEVYGKIESETETVTSTDSPDLTTMSLAELRDHAAALELATWGSKAQLIARIEDAE